MIPYKFALVCVDESSQWRGHWPKGEVPEIIAEDKVGRIFGMYLVDLKSHTHCCEATPSYAAYFVRNEAERGYANDELAEALADYLLGENSEQVSYFHCSCFDSFPCLNDGKVQWPPPEDASGLVIPLFEFRDGEHVAMAGEVEDDEAYNKLLGEVEEYVHCNW